MSQRPTDLPQLSDLQADALDALQFAALKHCVRHAPKKGELHIINNLAVVHARENFNDQSTDRGRHIMRLSLDNETKLWQSLPTPLQEVFQGVFSANRR